MTLTVGADRKIDCIGFGSMRKSEPMARPTAQPAPDLTDADWERLCEASETPREELVLRLCGEAGLRAAEVTRVRPADVQRGPTGRQGAFLRVRDEAGSPTRDAYLPATVHHTLHGYVDRNEIDSDDRVVDVSTRRVQMLVGDVADRAATAQQRPALAAVTPSVLRRRFARRLLETEGIDPRVVKAVGGWERIDGLVASESPDRSTIARAMEQEGRAGIRGGKPDRLATVVEVTAAVGEVLVESSDRSDIASGVCRVLAGSEAYDAAWMAGNERHRDRIAVRHSAGGEPERLESPRGARIVRQALQTGRVIVGPDLSAPSETGTGKLGAIPVGDGQTENGVLVVQAGIANAFDTAERTALADLGRRIATALTATKRRQLLHGDTVLSLGFAYKREDVFTDCSATLECPVTLEGFVPGESDELACFVRLEGAEPQAALACADDHADTTGARIVRRSEAEVVLEVLVEPSTPLSVVSDQGGTVTDLHVESGRAELRAQFAPNVDVRGVVEAIGERYPSVELRRKQEKPRSETATPTLKNTLADELTERQRSVLRAALHAGYFEWPRGSTAEELADSIGVSSPTLHNHLRRAQKNLLEAALGTQDVPRTTPRSDG